MSSLPGLPTCVIAPAPVMIPHPSGAYDFNMPALRIIFVTLAAQLIFTGTGLAKEDCPKKPPPIVLVLSFAKTKLGSLAPEVRAACSTQYAGCPVVQYLHERQAAAERMMRSPT